MEAEWNFLELGLLEPEAQSFVDSSSFAGNASNKWLKDLNRWEMNWCIFRFTHPIRIPCFQTLYFHSIFFQSLIFWANNIHCFYQRSKRGLPHLSDYVGHKLLCFSLLKDQYQDHHHGNWYYPQSCSLENILLLLLRDKKWKNSMASWLNSF